MAPAGEAELADAVRAARGPLRIRGGGTRGLLNTIEGEVLSTARLRGITLYEPGALTLVARAGTPLAEIEAALAAEGQRLPFEPMDHRPLLGSDGEPTIGGVVAANVSGPRRVQVGAARDFLLGVRFVDGTGAVVSNGGRVMKNVTGYDLVKLMAGSWGTLGILTEVSFKVLPAPAAAATLTLEGLETAEAVRVMAAALTSPFEVSGAAHDPDDATLLRIEGFEDSVAYRADRLVELLAPSGNVRVERDAEAVADRWRAVRDARKLAGDGEDVWRISVKPSDGVEVARRLPDARLLLDWGGGLVWAGVAPGVDLRAALHGVGGHATLVRASQETRQRFGVFQPEAAAVAALSRGLRARFDPRGILNPGLM
ncbi:glycolate oxidase subunit GlcE [Rhodobacteraceae bacterium MCCB 386]|nr:glycolate oxidase subunit GlcE [Roseitranquillus sediminis]